LYYDVLPYLEDGGGAMSTCGELGCGCSNECGGRHAPSSRRHL